jgi:hypothetical protein
MKLRFHCLALACLATLISATARDHSGGYLSATGPLALRLRAPTPPALSLPSLDAGGKPSPLSDQDPVESTSGDADARRDPDTPKAKSSTSQLPESRQNLSDPLPLNGASAVTGEVGKDAGVAGQMFLRFFGSETNSVQESIVVVPLSFKPAQPGQQPSSSVQYSSKKQ